MPVWRRRWLASSSSSSASSMTTSALVKVQVEVPGTAEHLEELHAALDRFWGQVEAVLPAPPEMEWRLTFATALGEAATNVVRHAYQGGALDGTMRVDLLAFADRIEARFTDRG